VGLRYSDKVKHIYRDFPALGENSVNLALAARCAGEQGLFWPMHDKLFQNQGVSTPKELLELANQIGADTVKYELCYSQKKYLNLIQKDFLDGETLGVNGTPTWFINGQKIEGDIPLNIFTQIIEELINK
jgi:protein-disulfide isomerase